MITRVQLVSIPVADQDRAFAFYTKKLGFELVNDQEFGDGDRWLQLGIPGGETDIVLYTPEGQEDRIGTFSNVVFTAADVKETYEELASRGVEFVEPAAEQPWGGVQAIFKDSEGNTIVLHS